MLRVLLAGIVAIIVSVGGVAAVASVPYYMRSVEVRRAGARGRVVRIRSSENRSAGAAMGTRLRPFCSGQSFVILTR